MLQVRATADHHRDVIVPVLPCRGLGTRGVKIWSTSEFIYLEQATRACDSSRSACRCRTDMFSYAGPRSRLWPTDWNLARKPKPILLNLKVRKLPKPAPTGAANSGVPCCKDSADSEVT